MVTFILQGIGGGVNYKAKEISGPPTPPRKFPKSAPGIDGIDWCLIWYGGCYEVRAQKKAVNQGVPNVSKVNGKSSLYSEN